MPKYKPSDLPDLFGIPLAKLAQRERPASPTEITRRVAVALHEAAHLVAAAYSGSHIYRLQINHARSRRDSDGVLHSVELLPDDEAFVSFVGYAWEELHGDVELATGDLLAGKRSADEACMTHDDLLNEARCFVRDTDELIHIAASGILACLPSSGILQGRTLEKLVERFRPIDKSTARQSVNASRMGQPWPVLGPSI